MEYVAHPGDVDRHIMRELGFTVTHVEGEVHGSAPVIPEMFVPGTEALRTSILATWADIVSGHAAIGVFRPGVPVTLDLDIHLLRPPVGCAEIRMVAQVQKAGRTVSVMRITISDEKDDVIGFGHAAFMAAPNPSLRLPTVVDDEGLLVAHTASLQMPYAERAGCERTGGGGATIPMRPDGLNASGTLNGGLLALVVEEAALDGSPSGTTISSLSMRFAQPVRVGPAVAQATVDQGLGDVVVHDEGRERRLAVIASTRAFPLS